CSSVFLLHTHSRLVLLPFFFSSRRRHTRSKRDWSSDVCSSDLTPPCAGRASKRGCVSLGSMSPATVPEWSAKCIRQLLCGAGLCLTVGTKERRTLFSALTWCTPWRSEPPGWPGTDTVTSVPLTITPSTLCWQHSSLAKWLWAGAIRLRRPCTLQPVRRGGFGCRTAQARPRRLGGRLSSLGLRRGRSLLPVPALPWGRRRRT